MLSLHALGLTRCDLWRSDVLGTGHGVGLVDGPTVRSTKLSLISSRWRGRGLGSGVTHVGNTGVQGLKGGRSRKRTAPDRVDSAGRRQAQALCPRCQIFNARIDSRRAIVNLKGGGDRLSQCELSAQSEGGAQLSSVMTCDLKGTECAVARREKHGC